MLLELAEIASIVARYGVMESIYQKWDGMSLQSKYESALIGLCVPILRYLDLTIFDSQQVPRDLTTPAARIRDAELVCRGFIVTIDFEPQDQSKSPQELVDYQDLD